MIKSYLRVQFYPPIQNSNGEFFLWKNKLVKAADPGPAIWVKDMVFNFIKKKK